MMRRIDMNLPEETIVRELIRWSLEARKSAYAPYSHYQVGAALLLEDGSVVLGANIENASYGVTNCAERTAIFKAVCDGERQFVKIAVTGGIEGEEPTEYAYPCGICRQVMAEFCKKDFQVIVALDEDRYEVNTLEELLPYSFGDHLMK